MEAVTWHCPACGATSSYETTCMIDFVQYVPVRPPEPEAVLSTPTVAQPTSTVSDPQLAPGNEIEDVRPSPERLALRTPWRRVVSLPDEGDLLMGRSHPPLKEIPEALASHQISRRHLRLFRDRSGVLMVEDFKSTNGTFVDGVAVREQPVPLRAGQILRFGLDVECPVVRINEFGEPEDD
ncbi:FHA domain-containing protein [Kineosporia rhizophila]|uniref:FHA domain-containing protein n=1 Tax=Kineosporia rhizophila TaxID=84633 RepID=UPI001E291609|nr:FHA domain-containing protein [Kineosporia rhizophila]